VSRRRSLAVPEFEERVRETFIEGGRLTLPAKRKKRLVVLRWAADMFRPAERYPETVVNRVLGRYYEDVATLRRMLVDEEFLQRRAGVYWRTGTLPPE
jgi:hypothetical protein